MKRKIPLLICGFAILLSQPYSLSAQIRNITGTVKNSAGEPIVGATVQERNAPAIVMVDEKGDFKISISGANAILDISAINYTSAQVNVNTGNHFNIVLQSFNATMEEVVVTALGIRREKRALGYASQEIGGADITQAQQTNIINALRGKVAGVQINSGGGAPGQGSRIIIRGIKSLSPGKDQQPLFVIDGILMDNSTNNIDDAGSIRGMSNRAGDINPDDIETINILRGGAATALYGQAGSAGVVVITTKSAKAGKMKVEYTTSYGIDQVNKFPDAQRKFTQGYNGIYDTLQFFPSWGSSIEDARKIDATHPAEIFHQFARGYIDGNQFRTGINLSGGTANALITSSISYFKQNGTIPNSDFKSINARLGAVLSISPKIKFRPSVIFTNSGGYRVNADRFNEGMSYWSPRWDVRDFIKPDGTMKTYPAKNNNPWYVTYSNRFKDDVNRILGNMDFTYSPFAWLDFDYKFGIDYYTDFRRHTAPGPLGIPGEDPATDDNGLGFVNEYRLSNRILNSIAMLTFKKDITEKFQTSLRVGNDIREKKYSRLTSLGEELDVPTLLSLNNAKIRTTTQWEELYRIYSIFGDLTLNWSNYLFLNITGRNDWSSTLVSPNNKFFYPSASLSYVFSEHLKKNDWLTFGKVRASVAGVGKDTDPYETNSYYSSYILTSTGQVLWTRGNTRGEPGLMPERTTTIELGTELKFFKSRLGLDFTWYKLNSRNLIIPVSLSPTTGYLNSILNAGEIENKGIEIVVSGTPVSTPNFNWDVTVNFSRNRNLVVNIREGLNEIVVGSQYGYSGSTVTQKYIKGYPVGSLFGTSYKRYYGTDIKDDGISLYSDLPYVIAKTGTNAGFPVRDATQRMLGNSQPKWMGGISNTVTYKNISFSMLWETQQGMQKYNQLGNFMAAFGESKLTENRTETIIFPGVLDDGTANTQKVWLGQLTGPDNRNYGAGYYRNIYRGVSENFVEDASWIRLRNASFSYRLPDKLFTHHFIKGAKATLTGNNLLLFTKYSGYDPESSSFSASSSMDGFAGFSYPALRSIIFSVNLNF